MADDKNNYYIDNKKFYEAIVAHQKNVKQAKKEGKEEPRITNYLGECLRLIAYKLSNHPWYSKWTFKEDMIADALENMILYFDRFDPKKTNNPFAYYTQISKWAFQRRMAKEMRLTYTKYKFYDQTMVNTGLSDYMIDEENNLISAPIYDNISRFIEDYEIREKERKNKIKASRKLKESKEQNK